jgi:hypothetical protein
MTGWLWIFADVVGVAILGAFLFYGQHQTAKLRGEETSSGAKLLAILFAAGSVALTVYFVIDASRRIYDLGPGSRTPGDLAEPTNPNKKERTDAQQTGEPAKEATCRTTPGEKQAGMSHNDCVFIASQIPVLASNTNQQARMGKTVPSPSLSPGSDVPADVTELKPLPNSVTDRLPSLRGFSYFFQDNTSSSSEAERRLLSSSMSACGRNVSLSASMADSLPLPPRAFFRQAQPGR